jgi:hypothetical protein
VGSSINSIDMAKACDWVDALQSGTLLLQPAPLTDQSKKKKNEIW